VAGLVCPAIRCFGIAVIAAAVGFALVVGCPAATFFNSSSNNWQYIQIDFSFLGKFSAIRRYMSRDGADITGHRGRHLPRQGEGCSYSLDGVHWINLTGNTTSGWEHDVNYRPHAWHTVNYVWSAWLKLNSPIQARNTGEWNKLLVTVRQRACQAESTRRLATRMKWARGNADCRSPVATVLCSAWSQTLWQFRNPNSSIRISLVAGRNFEPGTVGFQSAPMSGFIKSQIR
jgi:hypothetical protein